jgi:hypothetical protein
MSAALFQTCRFDSPSSKELMSRALGSATTSLNRSMIGDPA